MTKHFVAVALAACLSMSDAAAQSILQRSGWRDRNFATHLPDPAYSVPWLNLDRRNKLPKADFPIGREMNVAGLSAFCPIAPNVRVMANSPSNLRRM